MTEGKPVVKIKIYYTENNSNEGEIFSCIQKPLFSYKQGRLTALMDAIAEVYASVFNPNPLEHRAERGLLDFNEEMGIMIQEIVGTKVGHYFLPGLRNRKSSFSPHFKVKKLVFQSQFLLYILTLQRHLKIRALILFNLNKSDNDYNHLNLKLSKNNCRCRINYKYYLL